jgi:hypothetical protein
MLFEILGPLERLLANLRIAIKCIRNFAKPRDESAQPARERDISAHLRKKTGSNIENKGFVPHSYGLFRKRKTRE